MAERYQVVIVGGGPVGVGLAVELGQRGISTALVERHLEPQRIPKGQGLTARTLEHFYYWRCDEELRAARLLPRGYPIASLTAYGNLMSDYWFVAQQPIGRGGGRSFYFQANERLPQYLTERVLRNRLTDLPNVTAMFGHSAVRSAVMGLGRSVDEDARPTRRELDEMTRALHGALDAGYIGMSFNTLPWDKLDCERFRSKSTPSVYAKWK